MMNKNNDSKLALLTSVVLGSLVLFLIFLCHELILCIARVFVYLTGACYCVISFCILYIYNSISYFKVSKYYFRCDKYKKYKRNNFNNYQILNAIIRIEKSLIFTLFYILIVLYTVNIFLYL